MLAATNGLIVNGKIVANMIDADVFNENFNTCVIIKFSELEDIRKTYRGLTFSEGNIRLRPRTKFIIRAFVLWTRGKNRQDEDPSLTLFPLSEIDELIERFNTYKQW